MELHKILFFLVLIWNYTVIILLSYKVGRKYMSEKCVTSELQYHKTKEYQARIKLEVERKVYEVLVKELKRNQIPAKKEEKKGNEIQKVCPTIQCVHSVYLSKLIAKTHSIELP